MENVSEFDVLEWIAKLDNAESRQYARQRILETGAAALPWLVCAYNGNRQLNSEIAGIVREIADACGIPRKGGKAIKRIIAAIA